MSFCALSHSASTAIWLRAHRWPALYRTRGRITSLSLCRHVLDRLAPTLHQHRGCNLIDFKPGGGPWTAQLIDALQPTIHVEVGTRSPRRARDPTTSHLHPSTQPLHRHARSLRDCFDPSRQLLSPDVLATTNGGYMTANNALLITANLSGAAMSTSRFLGSPAAYFFNDLYAALFGLRDDLFRHGLVRVLAWLPDPIVRSLMPRGVESRSKQSIKLEAAFAMTQIAGTVRGTPAEPDKRWHALEAENYSAVQSEAGHTPTSRQDVPPLPMLTGLPPDPTILRTAQYSSGATFIDDWLHLDAELRDKYPDWFASRAYARLPRRSRPMEDRQLTKWRTYHARARTLHTRHHKIASAVSMQRAVDAKYRELFAKQTPPDEDSLQQVHSQAAQASAALQSLSREGQIQAKKAIDDYRAYDSSPIALEWNKRSLDPLVVQANEFRPEQPLALVVLTARPGFRITLDTDSKVTCFDYILNLLSSRLSSSVLEALQTFIHGPVDDFIETVPSLTDPVKGGCLNLAHLRVRSLPAATFVEIAVAYEKWPLRPDTTKMMLDMSKEATFIPDDD
ncbi:hypothetical protein DV736_g1507, partial [Chaetothyriales sp. CBS 134916]